MRNLISFLRDAWALVSRRKTMSRDEYEEAKESIIAKYERTDA